MVKYIENNLFSGEKMNIGEKIKKIRTAKLMTQSDLAGSHITRNMLSQIENGSAQPSMATVLYIAQRLNVSPGFLLAGEEDELMYFKSTEITNIKKAYTDKNYRLCREMCKNSEWSDDELLLILAECCLAVGKEEFCNGYLRSAVDLFDEALGYCKETIYNTDVIASSADAYFSYMRMISPTLSSNEEIDESPIIVLKDDFCMYSRLFCDAEEGREFNVDSQNSFLPEGSYLMHLTAKKFIDSGNYEEALRLLNKILFDEQCELAQPMLYFVFCDLEVCCKETSDFKGAYEYSQSKISLLQKLLS